MGKEPLDGSARQTPAPAEQNIEDRLDTLRTEYHQLRQARITEELLDVVAGFEVFGTHD